MTLFVLLVQWALADKTRKIWVEPQFRNSSPPSSVGYWAMFLGLVFLWEFFLSASAHYIGMPKLGYKSRISRWSKTGTGYGRVINRAQARAASPPCVFAFPIWHIFTHFFFLTHALARDSWIWTAYFYSVERVFPEARRHDSPCFIYCNPVLLILSRYFWQSTLFLLYFASTIRPDRVFCSNNMDDIIISIIDTISCRGWQYWQNNQ